MADSDKQTEDGQVAEQFIVKLQRALEKDGDFPASAKIINELRALVAEPTTTAHQITEVILKEPSLGVRILHLVNSSFYRRPKPIMTVSQAVVQLGMKALADLCAGLVLLQRFVPAARSGGAFAQCLQRTMLTSLVTGTINAEVSRKQTGKTDELGFLAGSFREIGSLLLAFYFPQVYENALKRAETKRVRLDQAIKEITGHTPAELSIEVLRSLGMPNFYREVIALSERSGPTDLTKGQLDRLSGSLSGGVSVTTVIAENGTKAELDKVLNQVGGDLGINSGDLAKAMSEVPEQYRSQCSSLELPSVPLPSYLVEYAKTENAPGAAASPEAAVVDQSDRFRQCVQEIRAAVAAGEPSAAVITMVMETLAFHVGFKRVLLLLLDGRKQRLSGRLALGVADFDPKQLNLVVEKGSSQIELAAIHRGTAVFQGQALLKDGWPKVALPVGTGAQVVGVIYADFFPESERELTAQEQAALGVLTELLAGAIKG